MGVGTVGKIKIGAMKGVVMLTEKYSMEIQTQKIPDYKYECELFGCGREIVLRRETQPNFFWRFMQYVCFGNKWVKSGGME